VSVQASTWVWQHSESTGNARLVLLAIADAADQHGENAWPAQQTIADMVRVSVRTVRRLVADLVELGELEVEQHAGGTSRTRDDRRPHLYRLPKMAGQNGRTTVSPRPVTGGQIGGHGRTNREARADTAVPRTSFPEHPKKNNPSGGAAAAAPEAEHVEDAVKTRTKQPEPAGLFEVERPPAPEPHGAAAVVASYVVAYRKAHGDTDPVKSHKGRVARDAKQILDSGQATEAELVQVAARLGAGDFASLGTELAKSRRTAGKPGRPGMAHAAPNDDPRWQAYSGPVLTDWTEDEEQDFQDYLARNGG
jgi:hypothetical protein